MIFDIAKKEKQRFKFFKSAIDPLTGEITYDDPIKSGGPWVELRSQQPFYEERLSKRKKVVDRVYNPKTRTMDRDEHFVEMSFDEMKAESNDGWDYAITDFGGFKDANKEIIEVTRENKLLMVANPMFKRFCDRCFEIMLNSGIGEEDAKIKNLLALPSGEPESGGKAAKIAKEPTQKQVK